MTVSLEEWIEITKEQDVADPDDLDDPKWQPKKTSVFWKRKAESDMKSLAEHEKGFARIFELDWLACTKRPTFMEQLGKNLTVCVPSNPGRPDRVLYRSLIICIPAISQAFPFCFVHGHNRIWLTTVSAVLTVHPALSSVQVEKQDILFKEVCCRATSRTHGCSFHIAAM